MVFAAKNSRLSPRRGAEAKIEKQIPHDDQKMNSLPVQLLEMSMKFVAIGSCPLAGTWVLSFARLGGKSQSVPARAPRANCNSAARAESSSGNVVSVQPLNYSLGTLVSPKVIAEFLCMTSL